MPLSNQYEEWVENTLKPLLAPSPRPGLSDVVVFAGDTDRTQSYVFESDVLPEIRGGSRRLSELNTPNSLIDHLIALGLSAECLLYAGGGSVLALLPDEQSAEKLYKRIRREYIQETGMVTFSADWRKFSGEQIIRGFAPAPTATGYRQFQAIIDAYVGQNNGKRKHFGEIMLLMGTLLRQKKTERHQAAFVELMPFAELCHSCRTRPTNHYQRFEDGSVQSLCDTCQRKGAYGRGERGRTYWIAQLRKELRDADYPLPAEPRYPSDIGEMVAITADRKDDVALVYADGDAIGNRLKFLETPNAYINFSNTLTEVTRQAVAKALAAHPDLAARKDGMLPWEVITIGGDDVLILMRASAAFDFAVALAENFKALAAQRLGEEENIRMSVGFAIARPSTPVRALREAALAALKNAKRRSYATLQPSIDFHNFTKEGAISENLSDLREGNRMLSNDALLTGRPFTLEEAKLIQSSLSQLRQGGFPRTQLYGLVEQLAQGQIRGSLFYHYQRARLRSEKRKILENIARQWQPEHTVENALHKPVLEWPWLRRKDRDSNETSTYTILLDLVELL